MHLQHGIRPNRAQFLQLVLQVLLVGLTIGMTRTVVPALADSMYSGATARKQPLFTETDLAELLRPLSAG